MTRPHRLLLPLAAVLGAATLAPAAVHGQDESTGETIDTAAVVLTPSDVAIRPDGDLLVADESGGRVVRVAAAGGAVTPVLTGLAGPRGVAALTDGFFLVADTGNDRIVRAGPSGTAVTVAGGPSGDDAAPRALEAPGGVAALPDGGFLVADTGNHRIRRVSPAGVVTTVAGIGRPGFSGDGGPATSAALNAPARVAALAGGGFLVADTGNSRIRRVDTAGRITTIAGSASVPGFAGDGGPAAAARLNRPEGVAVRPDGAVLVADTGNSRLREIGLDGVIRTVAGGDAASFAGDGGPASAALLNLPRAVASSDDLAYVADTGNGRVRRLEPTAPVTPAPDPDPTEPPPVAAVPEPPPGVAPPVLGRRAVASTVSGTLRLRLPGRSRFTRLDAAANVPVGTEVDARRGVAAVFFVTTRAGRQALALPTGGRFVIRQPDRLDRGQRPGVLRLSGRLRGCRPARARAAGALAAPRAEAAAKRRRGDRRLRLRAKGRIKTSGRYGSAIVRGTAWEISDRCRGPRAGTLVRVTEGVVAVTDRVRGRTVRVPAGERYLARAPRR